MPRRPPHPTTAYAKAVVSGKVVAGKLAKLACRRHLDDLRRKGLWFDEEAASRIIEFFSDCCVHIKGELGGQPIELLPWQRFVLGCLFGWKVKATGLRRFREGYVRVGKKNGKTLLLAGVGLYGLIADGEPGAEIYSAATKRAQAKLIWGAAKEMWSKSPEMRGLVQHFSTTSMLTIPATSSTFTPLGRDRDSEDGFNPHIALVDELHRHQTGEMVELLRASMVARRQPLLVMITTAGAERESSYCGEVDALAEKVLRGVLDNDQQFVFIAQMDEAERVDGKEQPGDEWSDEEAWPKANPSLGIEGGITVETLRELADKAAESPSARSSFLRFHCNWWTEVESAWIAPETWAACSGPVVEQGPCFLGLDLSSSTDLTALCLYWPETHGLRWWFWHPRENLLDRIRRDRVPYDQWADQGFISLTPGNLVDYDEVRAVITGRYGDAEIRAGLVDQYDIQEVACDPHNATQIMTQLAADGLTVVPMKQGYWLSPGVERFQGLIEAGKICHGNNPVARWMLANTVVEHNPTGYIRLVKNDGKRGRRRIDGIIAAAEAIMRASIYLEAGEGESVYDKRGILSLPAW